VLMSFKWGLLLKIRGYSVTLTERLMVYCSSMMWGLALPSTVGADGIRILLVRRFGVRVDDALATILVERGLGFVSALLMGVMSLLLLRFIGSLEESAAAQAIAPGRPIRHLKALP